jgi:hypothetical protein
MEKLRGPGQQVRFEAGADPVEVPSMRPSPPTFPAESEQRVGKGALSPRGRPNMLHADFLVSGHHSVQLTIGICELDQIQRPQFPQQIRTPEAFGRPIRQARGQPGKPTHGGLESAAFPVQCARHLIVLRYAVQAAREVTQRCKVGHEFSVPRWAYWRDREYDRPPSLAPFQHLPGTSSPDGVPQRCARQPCPLLSSQYAQLGGP